MVFNKQEYAVWKDLLVPHVFYSATGLAQEYYVRGEVKDSLGQPLQNVQIRQASTGLLYKTGVLGSFGFSSRVYADTYSSLTPDFALKKLAQPGLHR